MKKYKIIFSVLLLSVFCFLLLVRSADAVILRSTNFNSGGPCYGMSCFTGNRVLNPSEGCANHVWQSGEQWCQEEAINGGWDDTNGVHLVMRQGAEQFDFGWYFGTGKNWQVGDMAVWRFRIKFDPDFRWDGSGSQQNKITNQGPSGDRFIIMNERGSWTSDYCTPLDGPYTSAEGGIKVNRGIGNPCAGPVKITYDQWYHVQIAIKSGNSNDAFLKIWVNNNDLNNPDAQSTNLNFGVTNWADSWNFGGFWTDSNDHRSQGWIVDDLQIADSLDPNWYPGSQPPQDTDPPILSNGAPSGTLAAGTSTTALTLTTDEAATCRYSTTANTAYASMTGTFTATGGTTHSTTLTGLVNGQSYNYYVRCQDGAGNANTNDYTISFSIAASGNIYYQELFDDPNYASTMLWLTQGATHTYEPSGGWRGGCAKFTPPTSEGYSGLANFGTIGSANVNIRFLYYVGSTFNDIPDNNKLIILNRNPYSDGSRGIAFIHPYAPNCCNIGVCQNIDCEYSSYGLCQNENEWISLEFEFSISSNIARTYLTTQDGAYNDEIIAERSLSSGGVWDQLTILGGYFQGSQAANPNKYFKFDELIISSSGHIGPPSGFVNGSQPPDTTPPSQVTGLSADAVSSSQINLAWNAANDNIGVVGYMIYRGGVNIANSTSTNFLDTGLAANTLYAYNVAAYDAAGNIGLQSSGTSATTQQIPQSGVFFNEGWESGSKTTFNSDYYGNMVTDPKYAVQNAVVGLGNYAVRFTYPAGQTIPLGGTQHFGDSIAQPVWSNGEGNHYQDAYLQYKVYYSPGFNFNVNTKQFIIGTQDDRRHDNACCNPWVSHYMTTYAYDGRFGAEANNKQASSGQWLSLDPNVNGYSSSSPYYIQTGKWYTIEIRRKLNDYGLDNGVFNMWIDGELVASYTNVRYRVPWDGTYGANYNYGTNFVMISNYIENTPSQDQYVYYDDVQISTQPIGYSSASGNPGDLNNDGIVNVFVLVIIGSHFGLTNASPNWDPAADPTGDNTVDILDLVIVSDNFGNSY